MASGEARAGKVIRRLGSLFVGICVLTLVFLVCASLQVFRVPSSIDAQTDPWDYGAAIAQMTAGGPKARAEADGLVMTLSAGSGPYFLSELVPAEITLANGSQATYLLQGAPQAAECGQALSAELSGGGAPTYRLPTVGMISCPLTTSMLSPGQTWAVDELLPLTASGSATLTASARFVAVTTGSDGTQHQAPTAGPLVGRWPLIPLTVAPSVPADRTVTLHASHWLWMQTVEVDAPQAARSHLYAISDVTCHDSQEGTDAPSLLWQPIDGDTFREPGCPGGDIVWHYSVGAPGYAIASGVYPASA